MIQAVLDTNVIVSGHLKAQGREALILGLAIGGRFRWVLSEELIAEYQEVLNRPRFGFEPRRMARWMREMRRYARIVKPSKSVEVARDASDNMLLECALEARADYVVTGNAKHLPVQYQDIRIVAPRQFMTILAAEPSRI